MGFGGGAGSIIGTVVGAITGNPWIAATAALAGNQLFGGSRGGGGGAGVAVPGAPTPPQAKSLEPDKTQFGVPGAMEAPTFLGVNSSMTPLQQRSRLATLASQGTYGGIARPNVGTYAGQGLGDVAREYYKNVAMRSLLGPGGAPLEGAEILPVEWQYLARGLGQERRGDSVAHYLTLLERGMA